MEKLKWLVLRLREEQRVQAWQLQFACSLTHCQSWACVWQELRCSSMVSSSAQKDPSRFETQALETPDAKSGEEDDKAAAKEQQTLEIEDGEEADMTNDEEEDEEDDWNADPEEFRSP